MKHLAFFKLEDQHQIFISTINLLELTLRSRMILVGDWVKNFTTTISSIFFIKIREQGFKTPTTASYLFSLKYLQNCQNIFQKIINVMVSN